MSDEQTEGRKYRERGKDSSDSQRSARRNHRAKLRQLGAETRSSDRTPAIVAALIMGVVVLVGVFIFRSAGAGPRDRISDGHGPSFENAVEDLAQSLFSEWRSQRPPLTSGEQQALLTEARAVARRSYTFLARVTRIGREMGASSNQRGFVYESRAEMAEQGFEIPDDVIRAWLKDAMQRGS